MSWGEVKKINSDLSVPLDERASYVGGVVKRNARRKSISKKLNSQGAEFNGVLVDVTGKGILTHVRAARTSTDQWTKCTLTITLDNKNVLKIEPESTATGGSIELMTDLESIGSDINIAHPFGTYNGLYGVSGKYVINYPLIFEKSLKVEAEMSDGLTTSAHYAIADVTYCLEE